MVFSLSLQPYCLSFRIIVAPVHPHYALERLNQIIHIITRNHLINAYSIYSQYYNNIIRLPG